jgi:[ribosomal protein S5]-alanine N-acetyltransferase
LTAPGGMTTAMTKLIGRRLVLRPIAAEDRETWQIARAALGEVSGAMSVHPSALTSEEAYLTLVTEYDVVRAEGIGYQFGMFDGDELVGEAWLYPIVRHAIDCAYFSVWVSDRHRGNDYAGQAFVLAARFAFEELGLHRVECFVAADNAAVHRAIERTGLRFEGTARRVIGSGGDYYDQQRAVMDTEDWAHQREDLLERHAG